MRADEPAIRQADAYALTAAGFMGNNILPARGGDAIRVGLLVTSAPIAVPSAIGILIAERLLAFVTLLIIFAVEVYGALRGVDAPDTWVVVVATFVIVLAFGLTAIWATGRQAVSLLITVRFVLFVPITRVGAGLLVKRYAWRGWRVPFRNVAGAGPHP